MHRIVDDLRQRLLAGCAAIQREALDRFYEGKHLRRGARRAEEAILATPETDDAFEWLDLTLDGLERARAAADDPDDEDAWGIGAVGTVQRAARELRLLLGLWGPLPNIMRDGVRVIVVPAVEANLPDQCPTLVPLAEVLLLPPAVWPTGGGPRCGACRDLLPEGRAESEPCPTCAGVLARGKAAREQVTLEMALAAIERAVRAAGHSRGELAMADLRRRARASTARCGACHAPAAEWASWGIAICDRCVDRIGAYQR